MSINTLTQYCLSSVQALLRGASSIGIMASNLAGKHERHIFAARGGISPRRSAQALGLLDSVLCSRLSLSFRIALTLHPQARPTRRSQAMSSGTPTPQPSGYASPALSASTVPPSKHHHAKAKAVNVFSNDGSFLERFQHLKKVRVPAVCTGMLTCLLWSRDGSRTKKRRRSKTRSWPGLSPSVCSGLCCEILTWFPDVAQKTRL